MVYLTFTTTLGLHRQCCDTRGYQESRGAEDLEDHHHHHHHHHGIYSAPILQIGHRWIATSMEKGIKIKR